MREATEADLPAIVAIYNSTVPSRLATADTVPVSVESRLAWFRQHTPGQRPVLVHEIGGQVVAWVSFQPFYGRPAYAATAEVSIYIAAEHRGRGLGRALLTEALGLAPTFGIRHLLGFVFSHNTASIKLFRSLGFEPWGHLPEVAEMDGRPYSLAILGRHVDP